MDWGSLAAVIKAIEEFVNALVELFGPWGTIGIGLLVYALLAARRIYHDRRKDQQVEGALAFMEKSVQRSANEAREWRVVFLKEKFGWSDDEIERFVQRGEFDDAESARKALEGQPTDESSS